MRLHARLVFSREYELTCDASRAAHQFTTAYLWNVGPVPAWWLHQSSVSRLADCRCYREPQTDLRLSHIKATMPGGFSLPEKCHACLVIYVFHKRIMLVFHKLTLDHPDRFSPHSKHHRKEDSWINRKETLAGWGCCVVIFIPNIS